MRILIYFILTFATFFCRAQSADSLYSEQQVMSLIGSLGEPSEKVRLIDNVLLWTFAPNSTFHFTTPDTALAVGTLRFRICDRVLGSCFHFQKWLPEYCSITLTSNLIFHHDLWETVFSHLKRHRDAKDFFSQITQCSSDKSFAQLELMLRLLRQVDLHKWPELKTKILTWLAHNWKELKAEKDLQTLKLAITESDKLKPTNNAISAQIIDSVLPFKPNTASDSWAQLIETAMLIYNANGLGEKVIQLIDDNLTNLKTLGVSENIVGRYCYFSRNLGHFERCEALLQAVDKAPWRLNTRLERARSRIEEGKFNESLALLDAESKDAPENSQAIIESYRTSNFIYLGQFERAKKSFDTYVNRLPKELRNDIGPSALEVQLSILEGRLQEAWTRAQRMSDDIDKSEIGPSIRRLHLDIARLMIAVGLKNKTYIQAVNKRIEKGLTGDASEVPLNLLRKAALKVAAGKADTEELKRLESIRGAQNPDVLLLRSISMIARGEK